MVVFGVRFFFFFLSPKKKNLFFLAPPRFGQCCRASHETTCVSPHPVLSEAARKGSAVRRCVVESPIASGNARVPSAWSALKGPTYILLGAVGEDTNDRLVLIVLMSV